MQSQVTCRPTLHLHPTCISLLMKNNKRIRIACSLKPEVFEIRPSGRIRPAKVYNPVMLTLVLVLVLVLKDSLRTYFKSLSLSWSLRVRSLSLWVRSLSLSWSLSLSLVLERTCFHYSIIPIYSHNIIL